MLSKDLPHKDLTKNPTNERHSLPVLRELLNATNCGLDLNEATRSVYVKGVSTANIERAMVKLNSVERD